jgi:hypothetical protein
MQLYQISYLRATDSPASFDNPLSGYPGLFPTGVHVQEVGEFFKIRGFVAVSVCEALARVAVASYQVLPHFSFSRLEKPRPLLHGAG